MTPDQVINWWADHHATMDDVSLRNLREHALTTLDDLIDALPEDVADDPVYTAHINGLWKIVDAIDRKLGTRA